MHGAVTGRCGDCLHPIDEHALVPTTDDAREFVRVCRAMVNGHRCGCATPHVRLTRPKQADGQELEC